MEYEDARLWGTGGPLPDIKARSRMSIGLDIPEALSCHDRGVRIAHRLTAHSDANPKFEILATALFDIVDTNLLQTRRIPWGLSIGSFLNSKCVVILACRLCRV